MIRAIGEGGEDTYGAGSASSGSGAESGVRLPMPSAREDDSRFPAGRPRPGGNASRVGFRVPDNGDERSPATSQADSSGNRNRRNAAILNTAAQRFGRDASADVSALLDTLSDKVATIEEPEHRLQVANAMLETAQELLRAQGTLDDEASSKVLRRLSPESQLLINHERLQDVLGDAGSADIDNPHHRLAVSVLAGTFHALPQTEGTSEEKLTKLFDQIAVLPESDQLRAYPSLARLPQDTPPDVASTIFDVFKLRQGEVKRGWPAVVQHLAQSAGLLEDGTRFDEAFDWLLEQADQGAGGQVHRGHESIVLALAPLLGKTSALERQAKFHQLYDVFERFWEPQPGPGLSAMRAASLHVALTCATVALDERDRTTEVERLIAKPAPLSERRPYAQLSEIEIRSLAAIVLALSALPDEDRSVLSSRAASAFENIPIGSGGYVRYALENMLRPGSTEAPPLTAAQRRAAEAQLQTMLYPAA